MKNIIIAPHADDELIGCFQLLETGCINDVVYVERMPEERKQEALVLCNYYGIGSVFLYGNVDKLMRTVFGNCNFYIPSARDFHSLHILVHHLIRRRYNRDKIHVYSVYMNDWFIDDTQNPLIKKQALDKFYPSQKSMWEHDHKFFLFEGMVHL